MIIEKSVETLDVVSTMSYEESLEQFIRISNELSDIQNEISDMDHSLEIYEAISDTITKCGGVTKSIETLFGENFSSAASMEAETFNRIKNGFSQFGKRVAELFRRFIEWLKSLFSINKHRANKLKKVKEVKSDLQFPITVVDFDKFALEPVVKAYNTIIERFRKATDAEKKDLNKIVSEELKDFKAGEKVLNNSSDVMNYIKSSAEFLLNTGNLIKHAKDFKTTNINLNNETLNKEEICLIGRVLSQSIKIIKEVSNKVWQDASKLGK